MFLAGKRILIMGLLSNRSIAYGIARACRAQGAELAFTYQTDRFKDRVTDMAAEFGSDAVFPCDVGEDAQIAALFAGLGERWDGLDGVVHAIAFAPREAISGDFFDGFSREAFRVAHDVSAYSFGGVAQAARPLMAGRRGALLGGELAGESLHQPCIDVRSCQQFGERGVGRKTPHAHRIFALTIDVHGFHTKIKARRITGVQGHFARTEMSTAFQRAEIDEAEIDRFLEFVSELAGQQYQRDMGLDELCVIARCGGPQARAECFDQGRQRQSIGHNAGSRTRATSVCLARRHGH